MFKKMENNRPFLKMAFEGFAGDGKTYTMALTAIGLHKKINSTKPIAIFDTEKASKALKGLFDAHGIDVLVDEDNRSLTALTQAITECEAGAADILLIDSITHVWEDFLTAYLSQKGRQRLQFEDWGIIKPRWKKDFSNRFVQSHLHIMFSGRAGYEYTDEKNEETGKREIFKSGIKMKAENETAFEPDILVLMEKQMQLLGADKKVTRIATVIKDRTATIDGHAFENPTYKDFEPAINCLLDGTAKISSEQTVVDRFEDSEMKRAMTKKDRDTVIAEIEGTFSLMALGSSAKDKQFKSWLLKSLWSATSIEGVDSLPLKTIKRGAQILSAFAEKYIEYITQCNEWEKQPDPAEVKAMMDAEINGFIEM